MKPKLKFSILSVILLFPFIIIAQAESIFNNIKLNNSLENVTKKLSEISESTTTISPEKITFPLSEYQEDHLLCTKVKTNNGIIEKVIFTFSDNKLSYIQAKGNVYKAFTENRKDTARTYIDYEVYVKDRLFLKQKEDVAWILTKDSMHTNLFSWDNPYLNESSQIMSAKTSNKIPDFIQMGGGLKTLKPILEANSQFTSTEKLDGSDPNAQLQINCFGVEYLGFPRKFEARFGDNKLNVVWILTAKGEENRIRTALIKQFGEPIFINDDWEIFNNWQVGLRKDKPEVLLMEQNIGLQYKTSYFKQ